MEGEIKISPAHYDFLLEKAKERIRYEFDNDGNWITRQSLIDDCISYEMPQDFIDEIEESQEREINIERSSYIENAREHKCSTL